MIPTDPSPKKVIRWLIINRNFRTFNLSFLELIFQVHSVFSWVHVIGSEVGKFAQIQVSSLHHRQIYFALSIWPLTRDDIEIVFLRISSHRVKLLRIYLFNDRLLKKCLFIGILFQTLFDIFALNKWHKLMGEPFFDERGNLAGITHMLVFLPIVAAFTWAEVVKGCSFLRRFNNNSRR